MSQSKKPGLGGNYQATMGTVSLSEVIKMDPLDTSDTKLTFEEEGYVIYLGLACYYYPSRCVDIIVITLVCCLYFIYARVSSHLGPSVRICVQESCLYSLWRSKYTTWVFIFATYRVLILICALAFVGFIGYISYEDPYRLTSLSGIVFLISFGYVFSKHPGKIIWRPVIWGLALQFILGVVVLRTRPGFVVFKFLGDQVTNFLDYGFQGVKFVVGDIAMNSQALFIIFFFSAFISVLYYLGVMQFVIVRLAMIMQVTMGTSASESLSAAGNIFVGQTEAPLLVKPFIDEMTMSELHAIMTGGFATIAGGVLAAYISFGVPATHLMGASVMSAPAALAISKLFYPETELSVTSNSMRIRPKMAPSTNVFEAAANGASDGIALVLNIAANLIAFVGLLAVMNGCLSWIGWHVGFPDLSFELICSYVFMPLAILMGVPVSDSHIVAELVGLKTFANEFIAYEKMSEYMDQGRLQKRSIVIATYALCGFANFSSMGICIGGLSAMAPARKRNISQVAVRALVAGSCACFMTACIAGILYTDDIN